MRIGFERSVRTEQKASGHPEMHEEVASAREIENQILPSATDIEDLLPHQRCCKRRRRERGRQARVEDHHRLERLPLQRRLEPGTNRLDLGELRHQPSLAPAARGDVRAVARG